MNPVRSQVNKQYYLDVINHTGCLNIKNNLYEV